MSGLLLSSCNSDADCNGEGKCVQSGQNGSSYCDCTVGYIEPYCRNRDPCQLEGMLACQNGSTCKRISNYDYECKCRVPYVGEFCETYDLCDVDVDECIGDLNREDSQDPYCHPCIPGATCKQISKRHYTCTCEAGGFNDSSCYAFPEPEPQDREQAFLKDTGKSNNDWNPIIPTIAITSFCLYFLFLLIALILLRRRKRLHPKLIVCCNIHEFDNLSYYLISVETGRQWCAGTKSNVYCFLCGENGYAGPYPLSDLNLAEVHVLQSCQEDNYLVSHTMDLGRVDKIVLWYDTEPDSSWFCDKITVRNIKTEENWHFYVSTWFQSKKRKRRHEFLAATTDYVQKRNRVGVNCQHFCYQFSRHHSYISPFIYTTPERVTLMFAEWMSYMIILITLYGFLIYADADINAAGDYIFTSIVPENGSVAAASCFLIGLICALLLLAFINDKRIPTLLVWHNKPGMPYIEIDKSTKSTYPALPQFIDKATNTDFNEFSAFTKSDFPLIQQSESNISQNLFRIPSTDVVRMEKWVHDSVEDSHGPEGLTDDSLVHNYKSNYQLDIPDAVLDYGLIGGLTDGRQLGPDRFIYTTNSNDGSAVVRRAIERDIRDIYGEMEQLRFRNQSVQGLPVVESTASSLPISKIYFKEFQDDDESFYTQTTKMAGGDFSREQSCAVEKKRVKVYCELCEMEMDPFRNFMAIMSIVLGWILCIILIIAATTICCIYGGRYGYQRTYDWIISLAICWLENFLLYQFLKILLLVVIVTMLINRKKLSSFEEQKIRERLQVYYVNGLTVLPYKEALKYVQYLPKYWIPTPHVKLNTSNASSNTSIQ